jgi:hypothetical protein
LSVEVNMEPRELRPGDKVHLTDSSVGRVLRIVGDRWADVVEHRILGRKAIWRVAVDALRRVPE